MIIMFDLNYHMVISMIVELLCSLYVNLIYWPILASVYGNFVTSLVLYLCPIIVFMYLLF